MQVRWSALDEEPYGGKEWVDDGVFRGPDPNDPDYELLSQQYHESQLRDIEKHNGYVYFIQAEQGGLVKIGYTLWSVQDRATQLQTASPVPLMCLGYMRGTRKSEAELHNRFKDANVYGEWFEPTDEILELAKSDRSGFLVRLPKKLTGVRRPSAISPEQAKYNDVLKQRAERERERRRTGVSPRPRRKAA